MTRLRPLRAGKPAAARAQRREGDRRRVVDVDRQRAESRAPTSTKLSKSFWPISPRRMRSPEMRASSASRSGRELLGAHFQREDRDRAARHRLRIARPRLLGERARRAEGDLGGERRLAHARPAGEDQQVGRVHPAGLGVDVAQPGREAGDVAGAAEGALGAVDRLRQRPLEGDEPALGAAVGRQPEQLALGGLDLRRGRPAPARRRRRG